MRHIADKKVSKPIRYVDYAAWQKRMLSGPEGERLKERWRSRLSPLPDPLHLPTDRPRPATKGFRGAVYRFDIDREVCARLRSFAKECSATLFEALLAVVNIFLFRHTGQRHIIIGVPVSGRIHPSIEELVGCFVNTVPLPFHLDPYKNFFAVIREISGIFRECLEDQMYPFEAIVDALNVPRDPSRNPIFDVMVAFEENSWRELSVMGGLKIRPYPIPQRFSKVDLSFYFRETGDKIEVDLEYSTDLFESSSIERMAKRLLRLALSLIENPERPVATIEILPEEEKELVLYKFNDTREGFDINHTIDEMFRTQSKLTPDAIALISPDGLSISFRELDSRVQRLAQGLVSNGVSPGDHIGVCFNRSPELIQAIFAVLRIGAVYVPFIPGLPPARIDAMVEDAGIELMVCEGSYAHIFHEKGLRVLTPESLASFTETPLIQNPSPSAIAYIIFTSGSTGRPKGVMIEHRSVLNRIFWMQSRFPIGEEDVIIQKTPISFDVSIWELFWWSWTGATLAQLPPDGEKDPSVIVDTIAKRKGTVIHFVPSMLQAFLQHLERYPDEIEKISSLRYVFSSGEALTPEMVNRFNRLLYERHGIELHNLYGPTEATVDVTWYPCSPSDIKHLVPIGRPIANTKIYILDEFNNPCPVGVSGELCISGIQVARGYVNRPELTEKNFVESPFSPSERIYRTGDIARWRDNGVIEYLGRKDDQIKIRGFRIELGEIESALEQIEGVERAVARVTEIGSMPAIEAFLLPKDGREFSREYIRNRLSSILPEYMIPARFYIADSIPLNSSGKVDRRHLKGRLIGKKDKRRGRAEKRETLDTPDTATLINKVMDLWHKVLSEDAEFGAEDNFFEIGGNSILLIKLHALLEEKWPGVFSIPDLFVYVTVSQQASRIEEATITKKTSLDTEKEKELHPNEPIAIIGMAIRLSDFDDLETFWADLLKGADRTCPLSRLRREEITSMLEALGINADGYEFKEAAYLNDISGFDCEYFGLAPKDVMLMDPEQRLFLETALRALEDSGYGGNILDNRRVGVFVGASPTNAFKDALSRVFSDRLEQVYVINVPSNIASRLGYLKNWRGPAELVDTACSSTLKAVLDACDALQKGDCEIAIAGGSKVLLVPIKTGKTFTIESKDSRTKTFDAEANGVGAGEGAVAFVLKPLSRAISDGDAIRAVIRGGAVNQDGRSASIAAPNPEAQSDVICSAAKAGDIDLCNIDFFEAHGTGTVLGDPVEIDGITRAFKGKRIGSHKIPISSVKGNYGHLDAAAGGLGMAKAVLALQHGIVPKQPHFQTPNPRINFQEAPVAVAKENCPLDPSKKPWCCGISAFGLSGINVHVILEEAPHKPFYPDDGRWYVVPISAGSKDALLRYVDAIIKALSTQPQVSLRAVAATLVLGRSHLPYRTSFVCVSREDLISQLLTWRTSANAHEIVPVTSSKHKVEMGGFLDEGPALKAQRGFLKGDTPVWPESEAVVRVHLPPVPLNRKRLWPQFKRSEIRHKKGLFSVVSPSPEGKIFNIPLHEESFWPAYEHRINGEPILVGTAVVSMIGEAVFAEKGRNPILIQDLHWKAPLLVKELNSACLILKDNEQLLDIRISGEHKQGKWQDYAVAKARVDGHLSVEEPAIDLEKLIDDMEPWDIAGENRSQDLITVGKRWMCRKKVWISKDKKRILSLLRLDKEFVSDLDEMMWHPAIMDAGISLALDGPGFLPATCKQIILRRPFKADLYALALVKERRDSAILADCIFFDEKGWVVSEFRGISFLSSKVSEPLLYPIVWKATPLKANGILPKGEDIAIITQDKSLAAFSELLQEKGYKVHFLDIPDTPQGCKEIVKAILQLEIKRVIWKVPDEKDSWRPLFHLLKALLSKGLRYPLRVIALGEGAFCFNRKSGLKEERYMAEAAISMGMLLSVSKEEPLLSTQYIEMEGKNDSLLAQEVIREDEIPDQDSVIFLKDGERLIRGVGEVLTIKNYKKIQEDSVVVFSGGLGAMSLTLAKDIGRRFRLRIALIHRGTFPQRKEWDKVMSEREDGLIRWRIKELQDMEEQGIEFRLYPCDVCDEKALKSTLQRIRKELGPIKGVVHTAGIAGEGFFIKKTEDDFQEVLAPKIKGALNLHHHTLEDELDFFVLASSRTSIYGAPGQSDYTAANAWLDAFAAWRSSKGLPCVAIDWNTWAEVGMAARSKGLSSSLSAGSMLLPSQAKDVFLKAVSCDLHQVVVVMSDEDIIQEKKASQKEDRGSQQVPISLKARIKNIWQEELGYDEELPDDADFYALGGDSIIGMNIIDRVNSELGLSLSLADIFNQSTLNSFLELIEKEKGPEKEDLAVQVKKAPERELYPVSWEQLAVIQAVVSSPALNTAYNLPQFIRFDQDVDIKRLENAIRALIERHEILRTYFVDIQTPTPSMKILPELAFNLRVIEVDSIDETACQRLIKPFDLESPPLFRAMLLMDKEGERLFFFDLHHSIADAKTIDILLSELLLLYEGKSLPMPMFQQKDVAWWQSKGDIDLHESKEYWLRKFSGPIPVLDLPVDMPRPSRHTGKGATVSFSIPSRWLPRIREMARVLSTTTYNVMLSLWHILIGRYANVSRLVIAAAVDTRDRKEIENTTGMFVSLLPLLLEFSEQETLSSLIKRNHIHHADAMRYRSFNLNSLLRELKPPVMPERTLLSEVSFSYMNFPTAMPNEPQLKLERLNIVNPSSKADIAIFVSDLPEYMGIALEYYSDIFSRERMEQMGRHFMNLLQDLLEKGPDRPVMEYSILDPAEIKESKRSGNKIEISAKDIVSAVMANKSKGSEEIILKARQVASYLKKQGVKKGQEIEIEAIAHPELASIILGTLMIGAVCVLRDRPIPSKQPILDNIWRKEEPLPEGEIQTATNDVAIVLCSGDRRSYLTHRSLIILGSQLSEMGVKRGKRVFVAPSLSTKLGISTFLAALINGSIPYAYDGHIDKKELSDLVETIDAEIFIGGDALIRRLVNGISGFLDRFEVVISLGDLPETGLKDIVSAFVFPDSYMLGCWRHTDGEIRAGNVQGRPAAGVEITIVDDLGRIVPKGVWGTARFKGIKDVPEIKARWNMKNELEISGVGVELQEEDSLLIYNALIKVPEVEEVAIWKDEKGELKVVVSATEGLDERSLQRIIRKKLPGRLGSIKPYIIYKPFPLTNEGWLDYNLIKKLAFERDSLHPQKIDGPEIENIIVKIFEEIFEEPVSKDESFFELGGHSLLAMQIANRISDYTGYHPTVADIFQYPTPAELAEFLAEKKQQFKNISRAAGKKRLFPLSHAQQRLYVIHNMDGGDIACNMSFAFSIKGDFDLDIFKRAVRKLCDRHEILRTSFVEEEGQLWQLVHEECDPIIKIESIDNPEELKNLFIEYMGTPFDLSRSPLFRWHIIISKDETFILLVMHHIIGDGWSIQIMFLELMALYNAEKGNTVADLPPLPIQYRDYAAEQQRHDWTEDTEFWKKVLKGVPYGIELPWDFSPTNNMRWPLGIVKRELDDNLMLRLRNLSMQKGVSLATLMFSVFSAFLYKLTGQEDMLIGVGVAGRERIELENLIGFFINILPIRVQVNDDISFDDLLKQVNKSILEAVKRQSYPFDLLVKELAPKRKAGRESILNVIFEYQRYSDLGYNLPKTEIPFNYNIIDCDLMVNSDPKKRFTSKYDLTLFVQDGPDSCTLRAEFDRNLFRMETIEKWLHQYENFLKMIVDDKDENS